MSDSWDPWARDEQRAHLQAIVPAIGEEYLAHQSPQWEKPGADADFLSILALAQSLGIDFVPIAWHPEIETVGAGATAEIRQALVSVQLGLAFKRVTSDRYQTFSVLYSEISILGHAAVLEHENIVTLEGICWDVNPAGPVVWPVLVFRKAPHGSLEKFMQSEAGHSLSVGQALSITADIGRGIACLHSHGMSPSILQYQSVL
jgi:Protein tyrosine and serine/threonine kinase